MTTKKTNTANATQELFSSYFERVKCTPEAGAVVTHMAVVSTKSGKSLALWLADDDGVEIQFVMPSPENFELNKQDWMDEDGNITPPSVGMRLIGGWAFDQDKKRETFSLRPVR